MRKFFSPLGWLLFSTLFFGMASVINLVWAREGMEAAGLSTSEADIANYTWLSLVFSGGYLLAAAGIGFFTRGGTRARLSLGFGASLLMWVLLGGFVMVGPVVGLENFAPDGGVIPITVSLGLIISGVLHWNDKEEINRHG